MCIDCCCARLKVIRNGFESIGNGGGGGVLNDGGGGFLRRYNKGMATKKHGQRSNAG